ncbi:MAG: VWA domain-containing protein [Myxococcaceae bacterium]|nr:VWA domain-containing protein [Myxococcaceae bacterium]MCA3014771.1 VWA domain-containing protein [Myxococcaceae bacterium]
MADRAPSNAVLLVLGAGLWACGPDRLVATLPPDVRVDAYTQQAASKIDVLWVVDNSGSMAPRQESLGRNFSAFIDTFTRSSVDYRVAVTTTDIFKDKGALKGNPRVITPQTPNVATAFANNIKVGIQGSPFEAGLEGGRLAIEAQKAANAQTIEQCKRACPTQNRSACLAQCDAKKDFAFLRPDAYLYLVFVTDEEDESREDVRFYYRYYETVKGIGNDGMVTTAAIMGLAGNGCNATPGLRYKELSDLTGGEVGSICDTNFSTTLKKLATNAVGLKRKFALQEKPNVMTIEVRVKYPCNTPDANLSKCVRLDRAACMEPGISPSEYGLVCTPPFKGTDGWDYEPGQNLVFFAGDSVPGLNAQVELQYFEEGKGP